MADGHMNEGVTAPQVKQRRMSAKPSGDEANIEAEPERAGPNSAPRKITLKSLLGSLPPVDERIRQGHLQKKALDGKFYERTVILSKNALYLTDSAADSVKDSLPLFEITEIHFFENEATDMNELLQEAPDCSLVIYTDEAGHNSGNTYIFMGQPEDLRSWYTAISDARTTAIALHERLAKISILGKAQHHIKAAYNVPLVQQGVAALVFLNFISTAAQAELIPPAGSALDRVFSQLDTAFTVIFVVELAANLAAHWWRPFFSDGWSVFDLIVVTMSVVSILFQARLPRHLPITPSAERTKAMLHRDSSTVPSPRRLHMRAYETPLSGIRGACI
jgi:hypothetical protein